jgi:transposase
VRSPDEIGVGEQLLGRWVAIERARMDDPPPAVDVNERAELERLRARTRSCGWIGSS